MIRRIKDLILNRFSSKIDQTPDEFGEGLALGFSELTNNIPQIIDSYGIAMNENERERMEQSFLIVYFASVMAVIASTVEIPEKLKKHIIGSFEQAMATSLLERKEIEYIQNIKNKLAMWTDQLLELVVTPAEHPTLKPGRFMLKVAYGDLPATAAEKFNDELLINRLTADFCIAVHVVTDYVSNVLTSYAVVEKNST